MKKVIFANYDWDDNIIFMPTRIVFFAKNKNQLYQEIEVPTDVFAKVRSKVGLESIKVFLEKNLDNVQVGQLEQNKEFSPYVDLKDYQIDNNDEVGSFRQFRDCHNEYFMKHLSIAVKNKSFGPSFKDFQEHCESAEVAQNLCIITARGHKPETLLQGMKYLQSLGLIKHVPRLENIFPCSYKGLSSHLVASAQNPSDAKKNILLSILDNIQNDVNKTPHYMKHRFTFGFSDDDKKTMTLVEEELKKHINDGRWSNIEINLYFTGDLNKNRNTLMHNEKVLKAA